MKKTFLLTLLVAVSLSANADLVDRTSVAKDYDNLKVKANNKNSIRVIVKVKDTEKNSLISKSSTSREELLQNNTQKISNLKSRLIDYKIKSGREFNRLGYMVMEVDSLQLDDLIDSGLIDSVVEDVAVPPTLDLSVPHIGADIAHSAGYTGANQAVVILDTGVESSHPSFDNRVVEEACFSSSTTSVSSSLCPNGEEQFIGSGAGEDCSSRGIDGCDHGTHVAGIAAGVNGVAPEANIIAVQVFSEFTSEDYCGSSTPCILSYTSDQIAALEWVLNEASTINIAAINMSLGGGINTTSCDNDLRASIINDLRAVGIATVIASGNDGSSEGVGAPACISDAITVGSTLHNSDSLSYFSNSSSLVDLLAPGSSITSASTGGTYATKSGTSMATPHVAGSIAVLRSVSPSADLETIEADLKDTGVNVTDTNNNVTKPRIDVDASVSLVEEFAFVQNIDFEDGSFGDWEGTFPNTLKDHVFEINSGGTSSASTGPSEAARGNYYAYLETSSGYANAEGDASSFRSQWFYGNNKKLSFNYHMYGNDIGTLRISILANNGNGESVWSISGQQQSSSSDSWKPVEFDLSEYDGAIKVIITGVASGGYQGDIAIDNITISADQAGVCVGDALVTEFYGFEYMPLRSSNDTSCTYEGFGYKACPVNWTPTYIYDDVDTEYGCSRTVEKIVIRDEVMN